MRRPQASAESDGCQPSAPEWQDSIVLSPAPSAIRTRRRRVRIAGVALASVTALAVSPVAADVQLDVQLAGTGRVTTDFNASYDYVRELAIQRDGKIVVGGYGFVGSNHFFEVARYSRTGVLDPTFGSGGKVITDFGAGNDLGLDMALTKTEAVVMVGSVQKNADSDTGIVRYTSSGALDKTFGSRGKVIIDLAALQGNPGGYDNPEAVVIQPDGKIVVTGIVYVSQYVHHLFVARFNSSGSIDTTFGASGMTVIATPDTISYGVSVAVSPQGKILVLGQLIGTGPSNIAVVRLNTNGTPDTSFDGDGTAVVVFENADYAKSMELDPSGKLYVVGAKAVSSHYLPAIARLNVDGSLDITYGTGGRTSFSTGALDDELQDSVLLPDGDLLVVGRRLASDAWSTFIARLDPDGELDTSLDDDGVSIPPVDIGGPSSVARHPISGKWVIGGSAFGAGGNDDFAVARLTGDDIGVTAPVVPRRAGLTASSLASFLDLRITKGARVSLTVAPGSRQFCGVKKSKLVSKKAGNCRVTVTVTPTKGDAQKATVTLTAA